MELECPSKINNYAIARDNLVVKEGMVDVLHPFI
jgi:hypothetical protein